MPTNGDSESTIIGGSTNFWLFNEQDGFDITHPTDPCSDLIYPRMTLQTSLTLVTLAPKKTALIIIDMQNFFLSTALGRVKGAAHAAEEVLLKKGIPAARRAGIRILWLGWGVLEEGLQTMPPMLLRNFGLELDRTLGTNALVPHGRQEWRHTDNGIRLPLGGVTLEDGIMVNAGRMLMKDQWNTELHGGLADSYLQGARLEPADVKFHKQSHSGFWGGNTGFASYLKSEGITTLLFGGVNTDQCVLATLQDAAQQGYDTIMLKDACGTVSPDFAKQMVEFNAENAFGFLSSCEDLFQAAQHVEFGSAV